MSRRKIEWLRTVPLDALTKIYLSGKRFDTDYKFSLARRLSDSIGVVAPTGQKPEEVTLRAYGPFADYLRKHPFHHSQVERNDMGTFTSFDYTLLVTDELVDEILAHWVIRWSYFRKVENETSSEDWAYQE